MRVANFRGFLFGKGREVWWSKMEGFRGASRLYDASLLSAVPASGLKVQPCDVFLLIVSLSQDINRSFFAASCISLRDCYEFHSSKRRTSKDTSTCRQLRSTRRLPWTPSHLSLSTRRKHQRASTSQSRSCITMLQALEPWQSHRNSRSCRSLQLQKDRQMGRLREVPRARN
jgi:hypothetical protein